MTDAPPRACRECAGLAYQQRGGFRAVRGTVFAGLKKRTTLCILFLLLLAAPALAAYNVYLTSGTPPSPDGVWDTTGDPVIWTADVSNSQLYVVDIVNNLATANVVINTGSGGTQPGDITINSPVATASIGSSTLTLHAENNIYVNSFLTLSSTDLVLLPGISQSVLVYQDLYLQGMALASGTMVLDADATVSGVTSVAEGSTLQVGSGGTDGTLTTGTVSNNGDLVFNRQGTLTIAGDMSGTGRLVQQGTGTTVITGTPGCTGAIAADSGTLAFTGAVPSSGTWNIAISGPSAFGNMTLPDSPDLSGKTIDVSVPALSGSYHLPLVSWAGTATGTPALRINGVPVTNGGYVGNTALVYTPGTGIELFVSPACSSTVTISPGDSVTDGVAGTCDGGTLVLDAGTYREYGIPVVKSITIRGNAAADTTVDGMQGGSSILTITGSHTVVLDNLTLFNGTAATGGGAVNSAGTLFANSSAFRNCTAPDGGAIYSTGTISGIASSDFSNNTVVSSGGGSHGGSAIWSSGTITGITASTFRDGTAIGAGLYGAAIYNSGSIGTISSSSFSGGRTEGGGGAIHNSGSIGTLSSTTFSNNLAQFGGAILNTGTIGSLSGSTFNGGLALAGGAIANGGSITAISSTVFNNCRADSAGAGGAIYNTGTIDGISTTTFSGCLCGWYGGAIYNRGGTISGITSSAFTGCQGSDGGAIWNDGTLDIASGSFTGCSATNGGAIFNAVTMSGFGRISITSSFFTGNSAANGGAIFNEGGISAISSASFTGNSATNGGAVWVNGADAGIDTIVFSRFFGNTASTGPAVGISPGMGRIDNAENNWWGTNSGPAGYTAGVGTTTPWLVLNVSAAPSSITTVQTSTVLMKLTNNSAGDDTIVTGNVPDGIPVAYSLSGVTGSLAPEQGNLTIGTNSTVFDPSSAGTATITVTVDGEGVPVTIVVGAAPTTVPTTPPTTTPTTIPATLPTTPPTTVPATTTAGYATLAPDNDDDYPSVTPAISQADTLPLMTVTVNIGGDSKAWQAVVTGTKLSDLIVTGTVQPGSGSNITAPPGIVYQYISLVPARYTSITKAVIHFTVPQSWLDETHIDLKNIVMYHQTANGWEALPTTVLFTKDGTVYFSAESTGFSLFAIAGTPTAANTPAITTAATFGSVVQEQATTRTIATKAPVTTQTTAPPAASPQPAAPSPLLNIVLVIAAIGILASGGFMVRRWWIQRQNPTLYTGYD
jgi:hypothetical protein